MHRAPAGFQPPEGRCFYANLSTMLPHLPHAFDAGFEAEISQSGAAPVPDGPSGSDQAQVDHHSQICPNCAHLLTGHNCKLVCTECGYYMSCADYY
jgi:ribosomal protein S27AE